MLCFHFGMFLWWWWGVITCNTATKLVNVNSRIELSLEISMTHQTSKYFRNDMFSNVSFHQKYQFTFSFPLSLCVVLCCVVGKIGDVEIDKFTMTWVTAVSGENKSYDQVLGHIKFHDRLGKHFILYFPMEQALSNKEILTHHNKEVLSSWIMLFQ